MKITKKYLKTIIKEELEEIKMELGDLNKLKELINKYRKALGAYKAGFDIKPTGGMKGPNLVKNLADVRKKRDADQAVALMKGYSADIKKMLEDGLKEDRKSVPDPYRPGRDFVSSKAKNPQYLDLLKNLYKIQSQINTPAALIPGQEYNLSAFHNEIIPETEEKLKKMDDAINRFLDIHATDVATGSYKTLSRR